MSSEPQFIQSKDNALLKRLRQLVRDSGAYRKLGQVWLEGDHLCRALLTRGLRPAVGVFRQSHWDAADANLVAGAERVVVVADELWAGISSLDSPAPMGYVWDLPVATGISSGASTLVLDRLQDAGNVGSVLRSAAAFGFEQVLAIKGTAALWSPKVVRAGMGAHFALTLHEGLSEDDLDSLQVPLMVTSSHRGQWLHEARLPWPCAWVLGHEGQGVAPGIEAKAGEHIRIAQPGGEESLNVAAAAAICLHASAAGRL